MLMHFWHQIKKYLVYYRGDGVLVMVTIWLVVLKVHFDQRIYTQIVQLPKGLKVAVVV